MTAEDQLIQVPIFPLPLVLFPGAVLPLHIFEPRYLKMLKDITIDDQPAEFGITLYMESIDENLGVTTAVGTIAQIRETIINTPENEKQTETIDLMVIGTDRFRIEQISNHQDEYLVGDISLIEDIEEPESAPELIKAALHDFKELLRLNEKVSPDNKASAIKDDITAFDLGYLIGQHLNHDPGFQQTLLEMTSVNERLSKSHQYIQPILQKLAAISQIDSAFDN